VLNEKLKVTGDVSFVLRDETGKIIETKEIHNLVVTTGLNFIAARLKGATPAATEMTHMAVGTGTVAAALGNTTLGTELARVALTTPGGTVGASPATIQYACTFGAGSPSGTNALTEAGVFSASSAGTMMCRTVFSAINKAPGDSLTITWTITIS
jgi:hypothetical protein